AIPCRCGRILGCWACSWPPMAGVAGYAQYTPQMPCLSWLAWLHSSVQIGLFQALFGLRRGGRAVECTALEMRHTGNRIGGSNPSLSAKISLNTPVISQSHAEVAGLHLLIIMLAVNK